MKMLNFAGRARLGLAALVWTWGIALAQEGLGPGRVKITREARTHVRDGAFCACRDSNSAGIDLLAAPDAPRGFLQALIRSHRPWLHARIASSNPPTPTIIITRFML